MKCGLVLFPASTSRWICLTSVLSHLMTYSVFDLDANVSLCSSVRRTERYLQVFKPMGIKLDSRGMRFQIH